MRSLLVLSLVRWRTLSHVQTDTWDLQFGHASTRPQNVNLIDRFFATGIYWQGGEKRLGVSSSLVHDFLAVFVPDILG